MTSHSIPLFRTRGSADDGKVSFVELFFDLIFVFSIIQLSHTLAHHYTPLGALETGLLVLAIWWVWVFTTWVTNWVNPDNGHARAVLFVLMFLGLLVSTSIPQAFGDRGWLFALAFVAMQVGRSLWMALILRGENEANHRNFLRITIWLAASGLFWIAGGFADHYTRLALWLIALAIEYAAPIFGFAVPGMGRSTTKDWTVSGEHMAERCALFVIICLGETILVTGRLVVGGDISGELLLAFSVSFATTLALWWLYFRHGHERVAHLIETNEDPGAVARVAYTYAHIPIVAGIILSAVGAEFLLVHPHDPATLKYASAILGGPVLYVAGVLWFKTVAAGRLPVSHLAGIAALIVLFVVGKGMTLTSLAALTTVILIGIAIWEALAVRAQNGA